MVVAKFDQYYDFVGGPGACCQQNGLVETLRVFESGAK
jgi:hypothetical protein